jgi:hypothetical protein
MQTEPLENQSAKVTSLSEAAELIDRKIHAEMLERINILAREYEIRNPSEAAKFWRENLFLFDLQKEIPAQIRKVFNL